jgi:hypothetical protein
MKKRMLLILLFPGCQWGVSMKAVNEQAAKTCEELRQSGVNYPVHFATYKHTCHFQPAMPAERRCTCSPYEDASE